MVKQLLLIAIFVTSQECISQIIELSKFGNNPGNLKSYIYKPENLKSSTNHALVVVLHGCSQSAEDISVETGWNELAEKNGFIVLYPEQKIANNASRCFNWFSQKDIQFKGESESIKSMIEYIQQNYSIDSKRVYCYGLSAGGAMSTALMAQYPEIFNTGAVLAGGPYGLALNGYQALQVMKNGNSDQKSITELAKLITNLHSTPKRYPKLIVLHGSSDKIVNPINGENLVKQWLGLHTKVYTVTQEDNAVQLANNYSLKLTHYKDSSDKTIIKEYLITNLGHLLPVKPGDKIDEGGKVGQFSVDIGFFSTYYIAKDFELLKK